ncbi:MAG: PCP reductase family protein [Candidatus Omnitrophota bacterium]
MNWDPDTDTKFKQLIEKIPIFLRAVAQEKVSNRAENIAAKENHLEVTEKDLVDAFFAETPFGFQGPLKCDMEALGIDYTKYGYSNK